MSDSIENILIGLVRDSNSHMDKINNSVLSNNKLLQTLIEKVSKVEEENKCLREKMDILVGDNKYIREKMEDTHKIVDELANTNKVLFEKIETLEKPKPITKKLSKVPKEPKLICSMTTAKGNKCTKPCVPGETCCTLHVKMRDKPSPIETKKKRPVLKKKKRDVPVHNHKPGETPIDTCELCESHGDIFDPGMPDTEFEESQDDNNGMTIEEKLRKMLEEEEEEN